MSAPRRGTRLAARLKRRWRQLRASPVGEASHALASWLRPELPTRAPARPFFEAILAASALSALAVLGGLGLLGLALVMAAFGLSYLLLTWVFGLDLALEFPSVRR